jgi:RND family efflux transporter MFP subunit
MKKLIKYLILLHVLAIGVFVLYTKVYNPKITYEMTSAKVGSLEVTVFGIGTVGAKNIYTINAQTGGKILSILTDEGEWVKKGDLLVTIDTVDLPAKLDSAKEFVKKAKFELEASKKNLLNQKSQKSLALSTYKRYKNLKAQAFVSQTEYDKTKTDLDGINAQMDATKAHINSAKIEITRAIRSVQSLQEQLSRYKIYAPVDGYVIVKDAELNQHVNSSHSILKIVDPKTVWIKAYIDERISAKVKVGQKSIITLRSQGAKKFTGYVKRIVAQSDAVTGEREVNIAFDTLPLPFYINEQAEVLISTETFTDIVKIPTTLLVYQNQQAGVWIKKDGKAHFQNLKIIAKGEKELGVLGLSKETNILMASSKNRPLKEGVKIK